MSQVLEALERANAVRVDSAAFLREVRAAHVAESHAMVADALHESESRIDSVKVTRVLGAIRDVGPSRVEVLMRVAGVNAWPVDRRVRDLSPTERRRLAAELRRRAA